MGFMSIFAAVGMVLVFISLIGLFSNVKREMLIIRLSISSLGFMGLGIILFMAEQRYILGIIVNIIGIAMIVILRRIAES